jgi:hypothetical protein
MHPLRYAGMDDVFNDHIHDVVRHHVGALRARSPVGSVASSSRAATLEHLLLSRRPGAPDLDTLRARVRSFKFTHCDTMPASPPPRASLSQLFSALHLRRGVHQAESSPVTKDNTAECVPGE